jgi:HlyD family secretion protein
VEIVADAYPDQVFEGRVRLIAPEAIERQNVTLFQVRVELTSGQDILLSNMNVTVAFIGNELSEALVVPTVAVVTQSGQAGLLVPDDRDRPRFQPVTLGSQAGNVIQILEGVEQGDRVFVDLPPGTTLENLTFGRDADSDETSSEE